MFNETYRPLRGYISNIPPDGGELSNYMAEGSSNLIVLGPQLVEAFPGNTLSAASGSTLNWAYGDSLLSLGANHGAGIGSGNAVLFVGRSIFYVGAGALKYNGTAIGSLTADSTLRLTLYSGGTYSTTAYQAGLARPSAPTLAVTGSGAKNTGTYSIVYTKVRTTTGAESNASLPSNVVTASAQQLQGTFPLFASWTDATDAYNIYSTPPNFGTAGPWLFYKQITSANLDGSGNYAFEFDESELTPDQPPLDFNQPPAATHAFSMGNVFNLGGTYNGVGLSSSVPNYPEAFPPTSTYFLPEVLIGTLGGPQDGFTFLICKSSVHAAVWTGAPDGPAVIARPVWKNIGFSSINNVTVAGMDLYGIVEKFGLVRTGKDGKPDFEFGRRVSTDTSSWTVANVAVGYSPLDNFVVFGHERTFLIYHIDMDVWSAPLNGANFATPLASGENVKGFYTQNNKLYMVTWNSVTYKTYEWGTGTNGSTYSLKTPWLDGGVGPVYKNIERLTLNGKFRTPTINIYKNYSSSVAATKVPADLGSIVDQESKWLKFYVRNAKRFRVEVTGSGVRERIYTIGVLGEADTILQG
jgi:hypothetical protein